MNRNRFHIAEDLLARAHSPDTASRIFQDKVVTKPLLIRPSSPPPSVIDARAQRQNERQKRRELRRRSNKPRPLSAKQKRQLSVYEIPDSEKRWELYVGLNRIWAGYMREILGIGRTDELKSAHGRGSFATAASAGPMLASADFHGAEVEVVRSKCVSRVGLKGIVVKDTKFTFEIITRKNEIKFVPKEHTIFRVEVPFSETKTGVDAMDDVPPHLVFELHGDRLKNRAPDRVNKKFKQHFSDDV
ncbi:putative ribonuclease P complex subunit Pop4 [Rhizodiscina lignyota]|uniref:Ribonuclease P protein subunit n=1 Tax=Rhizodiscina lignyota TaxID=1504668 RepID=A0A9P4IL81_9PEZI|nr:putative ribonuclease P complex subunit Pop4 [Rhizodiscina lignyota]